MDADVDAEAGVGGVRGVGVGAGAGGRDRSKGNARWFVCITDVDLIRGVATDGKADGLGFPAKHVSLRHLVSNGCRTKGRETTVRADGQGNE